MLEAVRKGYWEPSDEVVQSLTQEYMESVAENGATCCHHTCGTPLLDDFVQGVVSVPGVVSEDVVQKYNEQLYKATLRDEDTDSSDSSTESTKSGSSTGSAQVKPTGSSNQTTQTNAGVGTDLDKAPQESMKSTQDPNYVEGYEMTKETVSKPETSSTPTFSGSDIVAFILVVVAAGAVFLGFMRKKKM